MDYSGGVLLLYVGIYRFSRKLCGLHEDVQGKCSRQMGQAGPWGQEQRDTWVIGTSGGWRVRRSSCLNDMGSSLKV